MNAIEKLLEMSETVYNHPGDANWTKLVEEASESASEMKVNLIIAKMELVTERRLVKELEAIIQSMENDIRAFLEARKISTQSATQKGYEVFAKYEEV